MKFLCNLDELLKLIEDFYLKYGENTEKLEYLKMEVKDLKKLNLNDISNIKNIEKNWKS